MAQSCVLSDRMTSISLLVVLFEILPSTASLAKSPNLDSTFSEYVLDGNPTHAGEIRAALGPGQWSWENPRPQGNPLSAVFVLAPDDIWAGGQRTLMHWDGQDWHLASLRANEGDVVVRQIWGSDSQSIWVVLGNEILQLREGEWVPSGLPTSYFAEWGQMWGAGPSDVWATGNLGVFHWDGAGWSNRTPDSWEYLAATLWGVATDDVTAADRLSQYFHWDGSSWQQRERPPADYLGGFGPGEPWFYNDLDRILLRFRAGTWESYPGLTQAVGRVWSYDDSQTWALGYDRWDLSSFLHFNGEGWSIADTVPHVLSGIGGSASGQVWAVGDKGAILRLDQGRLEERRAGVVTDLSRIFGFSEDELWTVGFSGTLLRRTASGWERIQVPSNENLNGMGGVSSSDLWIVGERGTSLHFDGDGWANVPTGTIDPLISVWASGPSDVWAGTPQRPFAPTAFLHWDGNTWSNWRGQPSPFGSVQRFWGFAPDDVWTVGSYCDYSHPVDPVCSKTSYHFDGSEWTGRYVGPPVHSINESLVGIWGIDSRDVWALALIGASYHWDGESWSQVEFPGSLECGSLWGRATNDVFAACGNDTVHWDGVRWSLLPTPSAQQLLDLWGVDSKFWAVGAGGTILRYQVNDKQ